MVSKQLQKVGEDDDTNAIAMLVCVLACALRFRADAARKSVGMDRPLLLRTQ
jgi:hypothetical protein